MVQHRTASWRAGVAVVALVVVAVLAGCLGDGVEEYPDGVTADGIEDPEALIAAHEAALDGTSYRVNATLVGDGPQLPERMIMEMRFDADGDYHGRRLLQGGGRARTEEVWHAAGAEEMYVSRRTSQGGLSRDVTVEPWNDTQPFTFADFTRKELTGMTQRADADTPGSVSAADGDVAIELSSDRPAKTLRLVVTPSGLIRRVVSDGSDRRWIVTTERIDGVDAPDWVAAHRGEG